MADKDKELEQGEVYEAETDEMGDYDEEVGEQSFFQKYRAVFGWGLLGVLFMGFGIYQLMGLFGGGGSNEAQMTKKVVIPIVKSQPPAQGNTAPSMPSNATVKPIAPMTVTTPVQTSSSTTLPQNAVVATPSSAVANFVPQQNNAAPATPAPVAPATQASGTQVAPVSMPTTPTPAAQIAPTMPTTAKAAPVATPKEMPAMIASSSSGLADKMQHLEKSIVEHQQVLTGQKIINPEQLRKIENDIAEMKTELGQIKNMLSQGTVQAKPKSKAKPPLHAKKNAVKKAVTEPKNMLPANGAQPEITTNYYVKALVQSRAWLQAMDGSTISVGVGDTIPGYGMVTKIDADQGKVVTNSGQVILFGINAE